MINVVNDSYSCLSRPKSPSLFQLVEPTSLLYCAWYYCPRNLRFV